MTAFDLHKLFRDVFDPQPGEVALVLHDTPTDAIPDTAAWAARRAMAERWRNALAELGQALGFAVLPTTSFPATGSHNAQLPAHGEQQGVPVALEELAAQATLVLALTQFSATAPLIGWTQRYPRLRAASMPMVAPEMEQTALAADYAQVARACAALRDRLMDVVRAEITFSTGDELTLDLRYRTPHVDDGQLHPDKAPPRLVNLPSGETYTTMYEGEHPGEPSETSGVLPIPWNIPGAAPLVGEVVRLRVEHNRVTEVLGDSTVANHLRDFLAADPARTNLAELGLGCNPNARVWGNVLEDEKAGPHIALGRSEHLGGVTGLEAFRSPATVWHEDFVYARGCPVTITTLVLTYTPGHTYRLISDGRYHPDIGVAL